MAEWQEGVQVSLIALIFALMVAKLVSVVISFRGNNLRLERGSPEKEELFSEGEGTVPGETSSSSDEEFSDEGEVAEERFLEEAPEVVGVDEVHHVLEADVRGEDKCLGDSDIGLHPLAEEQTQPFEGLRLDEGPQTQQFEDVRLDEGAQAQQFEGVKLDEGALEETDEGEEKQITSAVEAVGEISDSDDWEGVETSELEESFGAAASFVATQAVGAGLKMPSETQLLLYGLYKLATEGPCSTPQPSAYKMSSRAKWNAWQKLGNIGVEEAMHRYIAVVSEVSPSWSQGLQKTEKQAQDRAEGNTSQRGGMGPVFSSLVMSEEGREEEGSLETIHMCAREGDQAGLQQQLGDGTPVDLRDSDGRTALHWAADRGHLHTVELLLAKGAQIHAKDLEGQTALHYATTCDQEEIAKYLVLKGAEPSMKDNEGVSPLSSHPVHWLWMGGKT